MNKSIFLLGLISIQSFTAFSKDWSLAELTARARTESFNSQKSYIKLYQARHNVVKKVGALTPNFTLGTIINSVSASNIATTAAATLSSYFIPLQLIAPMLGFIYPSNWFALKESKLLYEAEKRFYISNLANGINTTEVFYLEINKTYFAMELYKIVLNNVEAVLTEINSQADTDPVPFANYARLQLFRNKLLQDLLYLKQILKIQKNEFAVMLNFNDQERKAFEIKYLQNSKPTAIEFGRNFERDALKRAIEINGFKYLGLAAQYAVKKRQWEFLSLSSDSESALGYGYRSQINISKKDRELIELEMLEMSSKYKTVIDEMISSQDMLNQTNVLAQSSVQDAQRYYDLAQAKTDYLSTQDFRELAEASLEFVQNMVTLYDQQFEQLALKANYDRIMFNGVHYAELIPKLWMKSPQDELNREERRENRKIDRAIKKGELELPVEEYF
jgi:hypothetical protein